jgi:hypothetical protein
MFIKITPPENLFCHQHHRRILHCRWLLISPMIRLKLFQEVDVDFAMIDIEMPQGTNWKEPAMVAALVENICTAR